MGMVDASLRATSTVPGDSVVGTANADALVAANSLLVAEGVYNGATVDRLRTVTKFAQIKAQAIVAGTPYKALTPTGGKKYRMLSYQLSSTAAQSILFGDDGAGGGAFAEFLRTPVLAVNGNIASGDMGNGIISGVADNCLYLDVTGNSTISGWIGYCEE